MTDLRSRQREMARQAIVDACADLVTERHHLDFSMKEVAERAGVSLRTVYNHFATREDLLGAMGREFDRHMTELGGPNVADLRGPDDIPAAVTKNLALFEELGPISEAFAQLPLAHVGVDNDRAERTKQMVAFLSELMPDVPTHEREVIALVLRHLLSHRSWFWLTREYGLTTDEVSSTVNWAISKLTEAAAAGDLPATNQEQP